MNEIEKLSQNQRNQIEHEDTKPQSAIFQCNYSSGLRVQ